MLPRDPTKELYPHREVGVLFVVLGLLAVLVAVLAGGYCQPVSSGGVVPGSYQGCVYPYGLGAVALGLLGFILFVVGIAFAFARNPAAIPPPVQFAPPWMHYPPPPPPPPPTTMVACRTCGRVYRVGEFLFCPNCGNKIGS